MLMPPLRLQTMSPARTPLKAALRACAGSLGLVFAYSCSYNLLLLAPSIYLLQIYDRVLSSRSGDTLLMLTLIVAFTVVVGGVLDALRRAALGRMGEWLEEELHPAALSACFKYAYEADRARASEAYRDLTTLRQFAQSGACSTLFDALWTPLFLGVLFLVHPLLGVIGALSALLLLRSRACRRPAHGRPAGAVGCRADEEPGMVRHGRRKPPRDQGDGNARRRRAPYSPGRAGCEKRARRGATPPRDHHADLQTRAGAGAGPDHGHCRLARPRTEQKSRHHLCHQHAVRTRACAH